MLQSNRLGADSLYRHGATACTDVTGFGLLGHLVEMVKPSGVDVSLDLDRVPLLDGAIDTVRSGIFSSLQPQNLRLRRAVLDAETVASDERYPLIFDPQTAGGLLASVPADKADACLAELKRLGYARAAIIGAVMPAGNQLEPVSVHRNGHR
jgi:selenide,water dikinase